MLLNFVAPSASHFLWFSDHYQCQCCEKAIWIKYIDISKWNAIILWFNKQLPFEMILKFFEFFISFVFLMHQPPAHVELFCKATRPSILGSNILTALLTLILLINSTWRQLEDSLSPLLLSIVNSNWIQLEEMKIESSRQTWTKQANRD